MTTEYMGGPLWLDLLLVPFILAQVWLLWRLMPTLLDWALRIVREHEAERITSWTPEQMAAMGNVIRSLGMSFDEATEVLTRAIATDR